jgi:hypothetical protein
MTKSQEKEVIELLEKGISIFVVVKGHTLGLIIPNQPNAIEVFQPSILRGSRWNQGEVISITGEKSLGFIEIASEGDFEAFRVSAEGFLEEPDKYFLLKRK